MVPHDLAFGELALFDPAQPKAVSQFYELRWYEQHTDDMSTQVMQKVGVYVGWLESHHCRLVVAAIGPASADGVAMPEAKMAREASGCPSARIRPDFGLGETG